MAKQAKAWRSVELEDEQRLTAGLVHHRSPCWSPDGKWLAFAADDSWVIVDRRGRVARVLEGPADGGGSFGPGGSFAFGRRGGGTSEIWMTAGGGAPPVRLLGGDGGLYREPAWSRDGLRLVVAHSSDGGTRTRLLQLELSTGARQPLTQDAARVDGRPAFSPDGTRLFFEGAVGGDLGIYALDVERSELQRATPPGPIYRRPAPLSAELLIAERQETTGTARLVLIDWQKGRERPLVEGEDEQRDPAACRSESGKLRLAWSSLAIADGKPRRADVLIARLRGIESLLSPRERDRERESEAPPDGAPVTEAVGIPPLIDPSRPLEASR